MRRSTVAAFVALSTVCLLLAGCGGKTEPINVAGRTYLNSQEQADSRTIQFNQDGTFAYSIVTTEKTWKAQGTYQVAPDKVTLTFYPQGEISEFAGKTVELKTENQILVDPDGSRWLVM
jgi:outer membrane biogenesis lipoprotein LolB